MRDIFNGGEAVILGPFDGTVGTWNHPMTPLVTFSGVSGTASPPLKMSGIAYDPDTVDHA